MTQEEFSALYKDQCTKVLQSRKILHDGVVDAASDKEKDSVRSSLAGFGLSGEGEKEKLNAEFWALLKRETENAENSLTFDKKTLTSLAETFGMEPFEKVLPGLDEYSPGSAFMARKAALSFNSIALLDDRLVQLLLRQCDALDLATALKNADSAVTEKVMANMSKRAAAMLKEDIEYMGRVRLSEVQKCQEKILTLLANLQNGGAA